MFNDAVVIFDCRVGRVFEHDNTDLIVGCMVAYRTDPTRRPLLSFHGAYVGLRGA